MNERSEASSGQLAAKLGEGEMELAGGHFAAKLGYRKIELAGWLPSSKVGWGEEIARIGEKEAGRVGATWNVAPYREGCEEKVGPL
jgi:hypothetical protein